MVRTAASMSCTLTHSVREWKACSPAKTYPKVGDNGRTRVQHFCAGCGSPLFTSGEGEYADDWGIRWGSIRQRDQLRPQRQIWCRSAVPWIAEVGKLPGRPTD